MEQAEVWRRKARELDRAAPYPIVARALALALDRDLRAQAGYKALLAVRSAIKRACRRFYDAIQRGKSEHYKYCSDHNPHPLSWCNFSTALQGHTLARLGQFKAWQVPGREDLGDHEALCGEAFSQTAGAGEVAARWRETADREFGWSRRLEDEGILRRIKPPQPEPQPEPELDGWDELDEWNELHHML
jgi:hypothetical protein